MQISGATMLGTTKCIPCPSVAPAARPQSRRSVMVAAHQRPHEGIMKAALIAAAAAQLTIADPSYALGNIGGIEPNRNRTEDYKARNAMDAAENKGPAVQDRDLFAPDVKGASKLQQGARGEFGNTSTVAPLNERATGSSKDLERAENAARNFPTAFSPFDLRSLQVDVGAAGSTTAEGGKQIGGGTERDAFDLKGPGSNQNRAAEIKNLKPNPGKAVEDVKEKIKSVLPTANMFDPASLQVNVAGGTAGQGGGDSARSKESLKNSGLIGGGGSSAAAQGPSEGQNPAQGAQNLAQQAEGLNPGKAVESVKEKIKSALPTANVFDPASLQVNVASSNPDAERRAQELKNSGITTGLPAPLAGDDAIPIKGTAVPNKDTSQGRRGDDQVASKGNRIFPTSSAFDASRLQVNVGLFDKAKEAASNVQDALPGGVVGDAKQAASGAASELKSKAGEAADINGGALVKELQDSKNKAPYVQPGPVRATPDILNLDEPGKVIRENASKLAGKVSGTSAPAMWGSNLQVNVGYGAAKGARPSDLEDGLSGAKVKDIAPDQSKIAAGSKAGDAGAVADEFGDGEQSVKAGADGTRPRSTETSDFRSGATDQSPEARFGAPTAIAKKISGQETV